ncbi:Jag N-terminal domain-containing protein [Oscillibacter sp. MSJ-2]|uniref:RNA-binding protein KhpB n=1 Tax=Dysosmobacter acutus TaxID=2841504 RepID=A0ABS6F637_9FIRM|nr:RNA-binding cell elongation regulator Jag/EloR [Dysosmobacter acutus]MBU5625756.1 Jag N-terminal domain-containing protein [Dysosmobacter acutus]
MSYIEVTGKNEDEAIAKALAQLNLDRDDVSVEILERSKPGFLGIGAVPAKVRVSYEGAEQSDWKEELKAEPVVKEPPVKAAPKAAPVPKSAPKTVEKAAPKVEKTAPRAPKEEKPDRCGESEELGELCNDEKAGQIKAFLNGLLEQMDSPAQVKVYQPEKGRYKVFLEGDKLGALIGRRGETLDAIQQLTNYAVNRGSGSRVRIHLDAENYRQKREQSLQRLAVKVAGKVTKYRRNVTLEPMNAYERHVIHTALQETPNITTYSTGTEPNRRVIVAYDRNKQ